jgi:hypothetical protein
LYTVAPAGIDASTAAAKTLPTLQLRVMGLLRVLKRGFGLRLERRSVRSKRDAGAAAERIPPSARVAAFGKVAEVFATLPLKWNNRTRRAGGR